MNTWAPLWSGIVESSLWDEPDWLIKIFLTMLALKDADHVVRHTPYAIGKRSGKSEQEVLKALEVLTSPDRLRAEEQEFEGRRVKLVEDGFLILNGEKYRTMVRDEMIKAKNMRASANYRARQKGEPEPYPKRPLTPKQQARFNKGKHEVAPTLSLRDAEILGRTEGVHEALDEAQAQVDAERQQVSAAGADTPAPLPPEVYHPEDDEEED